MALLTDISWTDSTYNPWIGCTKVSPACDMCYAETLALRMGWCDWGPDAERYRTKTHRDVIKWQRLADEFYAQFRRRRRVFMASLADFFDSEVDEEWRASAWELVRGCPDLVFQILTKRPQNVAGMKPPFWEEIAERVWLGATVEKQQFMHRVRHLDGHGVPVRFISVEPMLGPISIMQEYDWTDGAPVADFVDWVICGGESGNGFRAPSPHDVRALWFECTVSKTPFHFKQWGGRTPNANGCFLNGREIKELPDAA